MIAALFAAGLSSISIDDAARAQGRPPSRPDDRERGATLVIHAFENGLGGVRSSNSEVKLSIGRDPDLGEQAVLIVSYPGPTSDPGGRDVRCDAASRDWTTGHAIEFRIKPDHAIALSLSFVDRNGVVYTTRRMVTGGTWQQIHVPFEEIRPNPYFQPPGAKVGTPLDVGDVAFVAFAPQDPAAGWFAITKLVVVK